MQLIESLLNEINDKPQLDNYPFVQMRHFLSFFSWNFLPKSSMDLMCNQALETIKKKECQRVNSNENPIENLLPQLLSLYTKRSSWTSPQCVLSAFSVAIQMSNDSSRSKSILMVTSWTAHTCTIRLDLQISKEMSDRSVALSTSFEKHWKWQFEQLEH